MSIDHEDRVMSNMPKLRMIAIANGEVNADPREAAMLAREVLWRRKDEEDISDEPNGNVPTNLRDENEA